MASGESIVSGSSESYRDCDKRFDYRTDSSVSDYDYECDQNFTLLLNDSAAATGPDLIYLDFLDSSRFWIQRVLVPTILIIGVIGNLVTIVIMTRRRMRSSTNSYLAALATFDMIYLVMIFLLSFAHYPNIKSPSYYYYWILWPFSVMVCDASSNISIWLTVTFTIERYIAVCHPMRGKVICTESRAKKVIVCVFVVCFAFTIPTPFEWVVLKQIDPDTNATFLEISFSEFGQNDLYKKVYYWLTVVLFVIVPFCLLSIFNAFLIRSVHVSQKRRNCMTQKQTTKSNTGESTAFFLSRFLFLFFLILFSLSQHVSFLMIIKKPPFCFRHGS